MMTRGKSRSAMSEFTDEHGAGIELGVEDPREVDVTPPMPPQRQDEDNASLESEVSDERPVADIVRSGARPKNPCKGRRELHYGAANGQPRSPELEVQGKRDQVDNEMMFQERHHQGDGDALLRQPVGLPAGMGNGLGMPSNYQVATPLFNGKGRWSTFIKQFQAIAQNARWSMEQKLHFLLVSLKDEAAEYAFDLRAGILADYDLLVHELDLRFHVSSTRDTSQQLFYNRKIRPTENLREFAADLKRLILKAYPRGISADVREDMIMKQFFDGLHDEEARYHVKSLQHPRNLNHAVELVEQYYSYCGKRGMPSRSRPSDRGDGPAPRNRGPRREQREEIVCSIQEKRSPCNGNDDGQSEMEKLTKSVQQMGEKVVSSVEGMSSSLNKFMQANSKPFPTHKRQWTCFRCGELGHISRECTKYPTRTASQSATRGNDVGSAQ